MSYSNHESREIDLLELFNIMGRGIKNAFLSLLKTIVFLIVFGVKLAHYIALAAIVGGAIGWIFFSLSQRYYSSDLIAQPNGINATDMVQYINDLNKFCKKNNNAALSYSLDLSDTTAKKIKNIEAFRYIDVNRDKIGDFVDFNNSFSAEDTNQQIDEKRIYLRVEVYDNTAFNSVRDGIFSYISKNPYLLKLNDIRKNELSELVFSIEKEINKLDSLQNVDYFKNNTKLTTGSGEGSLMFLSEKDKQMYYKDKMVLIKQKQNYLKELELATTPITVIKDFTQLTVEENPRGNYILWFGLGLGLLCYIILMIVKYYQKILFFITVVR
jgi:hypothetical protein